MQLIIFNSFAVHIGTFFDSLKTCPVLKVIDIRPFPNNMLKQYPYLLLLLTCQLVSTLLLSHCPC